MNEDIPQFLRLSKEARAAAWKGKRPTAASAPKRKRNDWRLPSTIDATGLALLRQIEKDKATAVKARLTALRKRKP